MNTEPTIGGVGMFTPPPAPCGTEGCQYVELDCVHVADCDQADELIATQPHQGITHKRAD